MCTMIITVSNIGNIPLDISVLIWVRSQAISLYDGYFLNFETGALG
jgi:hypothetical protein